MDAGIDKYATVRRAGGSFIVTIPNKLVRAFDLSHGDTIRWTFDESGARLEFYKITPAERVEAAE